MTSNLRARAMFAGDRLLRRGQIAQYLNQTNVLNQDTVQAAEERRQNLKAFLVYAASATHFYSDVWPVTNLDAFPVIDKTTVKTRGDEMLCADYSEDELYKAETSGSTGVPLAVFHSKDKRKQMNAESIYFGQLAGYPFGQKLFMLLNWSTRKQRSRLSRFLVNFEFVDVMQLEESGALELVQQIGSSRQSCSLLAFPSGLHTVVKAAEKSGIETVDSPLTSVITQSEVSYPDLRDRVQRLFGVKPMDRYGLEEFGVVAQQTLESPDDYIVNRASKHVEILAIDSDESVEVGELGRVVITDVYSLAQPLIRYDTGDLAVLAERDSAGCARKIREIQGRRLDQIYDAEDKPISPWVFNHTYWKYPEIQQYQLVQTGRGEYILKISAPDSFEGAEVFRSEFEEHLGLNAQVRLERVNDLPVLSSGKRKVVVNEFGNSR